jgi:hypothetical protein
MLGDRRNDMGYRSDGRWVIKGPADAMTAAWAELRLNPPAFKSTPNISGTQPSLNDFDFYVVGDTGYIRFEFNGWKWYSGYPDVQWYEAVWGRLASNEALSGKRVHIGEDNAVEESVFGEGYSIELFAVCHFEDYEPPQPNEGRMTCL